MYVGRLGPEKGLNSLIDAWRLWGAGAPSLELIGDGPERVALERQVAAAGLTGKVALLGQLSFAATQARLAQARLLVLPSLSYEGFPMSIREAFALGVPVAGSRLGSIPCIVDDGRNGVLFAPGDARDLQRAVRDLWADPARLEAMAAVARAEFDHKYTADRNYASLMEIYAAAIGSRDARRSAGA